MSETRKKIIQLIEPFMDKTLCDGCIVQGDVFNKSIPHKDYSNGFDPVWVQKYLIYNYGGGYSVMHKGKYRGLVVKPRNCKIIGHYDITAVLKYIDSLDPDIDLQWQYGDEFFYFVGCVGYSNTPNGEDCLGEFEYKIPNKPLHLYTEQEEQALLDLLTKLQKKGQKKY